MALTVEGLLGSYCEVMFDSAPSLAAALVVLGLLVSCTGEPPEPPEPQMLVDHELWVELGPEDDPFEDRPDEVDCSPLAYGYEFIGEHSLEVDLTDCDYLSASQPSLVGVEPGDDLEVRLWHNALSGPAGQSHIALMLDGELVWEVFLEIPGTSELLNQVLPSTVTAPAGSEVVYHVHNHGSNTYNLIEFSSTDL